MEKHIQKMACMSTAGLLLLATTPTIALAEEERGGIDLLIPAPA